MRRKKCKQKITSFLIVISMMLTCITPLGVSAEEGPSGQDVGITVESGKAVYSDMGLISGWDSTSGYDYIWFGNYKNGTNGTEPALKWRVLDDRTNTGESGYFLLACGSVDSVYFERTGDPIGSGTSNIWGDLVTGNTQIDNLISSYTKYGYTTLWTQSDARMWCRDFAGTTVGSYKWSNTPGAFTSLEQAAILPTSKSDNAYTSKYKNNIGITYETVFMGYNNILTDDKVFLPSAEEVYNEDYGIKENVEIYTLLRSYPLPYTDNALEVGMIKYDQIFVLNAFSEVFEGALSEQMQEWANSYEVTPACNLAPDKALFTMAADNSGQVDFALVKDYAGSEWKLTLKDSNSFADGTSISENTTWKAGDSLTVTHKALNSLHADYTNVTAALLDESGNVYAYGSINDVTDATSSTFTIPAECEDGTYTLMISGEDWNTAHYTNYATGTPFSTTITVGTPHEHGDKISKKAIYTKDELLGISEAGFYHLVRDIDLGETTWTPADGVVLCLNGYKISGESDEVVKVTSGTFTVEDCKVSGQILGATGSALSCTGNGKCDIYGGGFGGKYGIRLTDGGKAYLYAAPEINGTVADFYVDSDSRICIAAELNGEPKYTVHMNEAGIFTDGWQTYMSSANMGNFFAMKDNHMAILEKDTTNGELKLVGITKHSICGASCNHGTDGTVKNEHIMADDTVWIKLSNDSLDQDPNTSDIQLTDGNYYLAESVEVNTKIYITGDVLLCLNGNAIIQTALSNTIIVNSGSHLTLCDCSKEQTGAIKNKNGIETYSGVVVNGTLDMYGGQITGFDRKANGDGAGVSVSGTFNMYGGSIHDNKITTNVARNGAGVCVTTGATFNMYGGTITNNKLEANYSNNYTDKPANGGGVYVYDGTFTMYGGEISGNTVNYTGSNANLRSKGGGVYVGHYEYSQWNYANFKMYGGTISNNTADNYGAGVWIESGRMTVSSNPQIYGNKNESGNLSNVGINTTNSISKARLAVDGLLTNTTPIGIHIPGIDAADISGITADAYIFGYPDTTQVSDLVECASHFKGDHLYKFRSNYGVSVTDDNMLKLAAPEIVQQPAADNAYTVLTNLDSEVTGYQWKKNGAVVASETGKTLKNFGSGEKWQCVITLKWTAAGGQTGTVTLTTNTITTQETLSGNVSITGIAEVGQTLTANVTGSNDSNSLKYNWYRDDSTASIGTGSTYTLTVNDYNKNITCKVTSSQYSGEISKTVGPVEKGTPQIGTVTSNELSDTLDISQVTLSRTDVAVAGTLELTSTALQYGRHEYSWKFIPENEAYKEITGTVDITVNDTKYPTAECTINESTLRKFINSITFGIFCKDTAVLKVEATDSGSGVDSVKYYVSASKVEEPSAINDWTTYNNSVSLSSESANYIYVKVTDNAGNTVVYADGVVVYTESEAVTTKVDYTFKEGKDKEILVELNGNTVNSITALDQNILTKSSGNTLTAETDYRVDTANGKIIVSGEYLDTLNASDTAYSFQVKYSPVGIDTDQVNMVTTFSVQVSKATLHAESGNVTASGTYGAKLHELTVSGPKVTSYGRTIEGQWEMTGEDIPTVGDTVTYTATFVPNADIDNYEELTKEVVLNIAKADAEYTAPVAKIGLTYQNTVSQELISAGSTEHGTMKYAIGSSSTAAPENGWNTKIPTSISAGKYYVWYKVFGDTNHNDSEANCVEVSIAKADADTIILPEKEYVYTIATTGNEQEISEKVWADSGKTTYAVNKESCNLETYITNVQIDENGKLTYDTTQASEPVAGLYIIVTVTTANYKDFDVKLPIELSDKKVVDITLPTAQDMTYNNKPHAGYTGTPAVNGYNDIAFNITYEGIGDTTYQATTEKPINVGDYKATFIIDDDRVQGSASLEFSISKGTPVLTDVKSNVLENTTDLNAINVTYNTNDWSKGTLTIHAGQNLTYGNNSIQYTFTPDDTQNLNTVSGSVDVLVKDTISPTITISAAEKQWNQSFNNITFDLLFNKTQQVTISYADNEGGSGLLEMLYFVSDKELSTAELDTITWKSYSDTFNITPDGNYVIYAKAVDNDENTVIVNSDGIKLDETKPLLAGISDNEVYYGDLTIEVSEEHPDVKDVTVDGEPVVLEEGKYTIASDNNMHTIVVTDNAGNETTYKITVFKIYDVTFIVDGVEYMTIQVNHGADAELPEIPPKSGYDKTAPKWDHDGKSITEDTEINALYTKNPSKKPQKEPIKILSPEIKKFDYTKLGLSRDETDKGVVIRLSVEETIASAADKSLIDSLLKPTQKVGMYLDIRLLKKVGTGAETVISYPNQHVTINLVVPDEIISKDADIEKVYSIARVHDGKADMLKADFDKGTNIITFETDRFSTYAIVYGDAKYNAATAVETGDGFHAELYGLILAISAILLLTATLFRKKTSNS